MIFRAAEVADMPVLHAMLVDLARHEGGFRARGYRFMILDGDRLEALQ